MYKQIKDELPLKFDIDQYLRAEAAGQTTGSPSFSLEFLESAYHHYDIVIWSATGMKWVELKMKELEVLAPPPEFSFKILTLLDSSSMVTVHSERYGVVNCKPLAFIWDHPVFKGHYDARNTIMFDDISRNFLNFCVISGMLLLICLCIL